MATTPSWDLPGSGAAAGDGAPASGQLGPGAGDAPVADNGTAAGDPPAAGEGDRSQAAQTAGIPGLSTRDPFGKLSRLASFAMLLSAMTTLALAFLLFGRKRRDESPTESDENLAAAAASPYAMLGSELAPAYAGVDPGTGGTDVNLPRWRRPSLLAARTSDPVRNGSGHVSRTFDDPGVGTAGGERQVVRYRLVRLLDRPDELLSHTLDSLDEGDEVQVLEHRGAYRRVQTPDGRQGWLHRMTLGDLVTDVPASTPGTGIPDDVLLAYLSARARRAPQRET